MGGVGEKGMTLRRSDDLDEVWMSKDSVGCMWDHFSRMSEDSIGYVWDYLMVV